MVQDSRQAFPCSLVELFGAICCLFQSFQRVCAIRRGLPQRCFCRVLSGKGFPAARVLQTKPGAFGARGSGDSENAIFADEIEAQTSAFSVRATSIQSRSYFSPASLL